MQNHNEIIYYFKINNDKYIVINSITSKNTLYCLYCSFFEFKFECFYYNLSFEISILYVIHTHLTLIL